MGVAVSKVAMLTHCQALTQACNYCEGEYHCKAGIQEVLLRLILFKKHICSTTSISVSACFRNQERHW